MKLYFLCNPSRPQRLRGIQALAAEHARRQKHGAYFGVVDRRLSDSTERLLDEATALGCTRIVAIGGDGTYNRLIRLLAARRQLSRMEIALVPAGTCNDFLRAWPLRRMDDALRLACSGRVVETDVGELNGELFLNNAGFGRRRVPTGRRKVNALKTLTQFKPVTLHLSWESGSSEGEFYMGLACNAPFFSKGLYFSRKVSIHDGWLDFFFVPQMPKAKLAAMLLLGRLGRPLRSRQLLTLRLKHLDIRSEQDLWPQLDGEPQTREPVRRLRFGLSSVKALIVRPYNKER